MRVKNFADRSLHRTSLYQTMEKMYRESFFVRLFRTLFSKLSVFRRLRFYFASQCEKSRILCALDGAAVHFLNKDLRYYGTGLFFFGASLLAHSAFSLFPPRESFFVPLLFENSHFMIGFCSVLLSVILMSSMKCLAAEILESRFFSFVCFDVFCFDRKGAERVERKKSSHTLPIVLGLILGVLACFVSVRRVLAAILFCLLLYTVMRIPENGVILVLLTGAFVSERYLTLFVAVTVLSFLFKFLRNKRVVTFELTDLAVMFLSVSILLTGVIGFHGLGVGLRTFMVLLYILFAFVLSNVIRTTALAERCVRATLVSVTAACAIGLFFAVYVLFPHALLSTFASVFERCAPLIGVAALFSAPGLLVVAIPLAVARFIKEKTTGRRLGLLFPLALMAVYGIAFFRIHALAGVCIAALIMIAIRYPKARWIVWSFLFLSAAYLIVRPFLPFDPSRFLKQWFGESAYAGVSGDDGPLLSAAVFSHFSGTGSGASQRVLSYFFGGSGPAMMTGCSHVSILLLEYGICGLLAYLFMMSAFSADGLSFLSDARYTGHPFSPYLAALTASCAALLFQSFFSDIWSNNRILLYTFCVCYMIVSLRRGVVREYVPDRYEALLYEEHL